MERRTISLLVVLVVAYGMWVVLKPKPQGLDDPAWDCPTSAKSSAWDCVKKPPKP
jgi:hypothetical protein